MKCFRFLLAPLSAAFLVLLPLSQVLQAAEIRITPRLLTSVIYTDNFNYSATDKIAARGLEISPGFVMERDGKRVDFRLDYAARSINYDVADSSVNHMVNAFGAVELVRNLFFVETTGSLTRQPERASGEALSQYKLGLGGSDVIMYGISPYLVWGNGLRGIAGTLRYQFNDVIHDQEGVVDASSSSVLLDASNEGSGQRFRWQGSYLWRESTFSTKGKAVFESVTMRLFFPLNFRLGLLFDSGYERNEYQTDALLSPPEGSFWLAGLRWKPRKNFYMQATSGRRFFGETYALDASYQSGTAVWSLTYTEKVSTYLEKLLEVGGQLTSSSSLLDQARLPSAEIEDATLLTKSWSGQLVVERKTTTVAVDVFNRYRQSQLEAEREDRSYGGSGKLDFHLSPSDSLSLGMLVTRIEDIAFNGKSDLISGGLEYRHSFSRYLHGTATYRRSREDSDVNPDVFSENVVKFSLLFQFSAEANAGGALGTELFRKAQKGN